MEFTVELRYRSGSSTVLSLEADTADQALEDARDPRRPLVGIHITAPATEDAEAFQEPRRATAFTPRRIPAQHRPSRRHR
jgi:hypothetical protein